MSLHPESGLLLQLVQLRLALLQLPLQKLQLFLAFEEKHTNQRPSHNIQQKFTKQIDVDERATAQQRVSGKQALTSGWKEEKQL